MIKVFVSSTFKDMQKERDAIELRLLPEFRGIASSLGEDFDICDLRWGIDTLNMSKGDSVRAIARTCFDQIRSCEPYMVVIIGDKYGTVPEDEYIDDILDIVNSGGRCFDAEDIANCSYTELEIKYGPLNNEFGEKYRKSSVFMFRNSIDNAPADSVFEKEKDPGRQAALTDLKERIIRSDGITVERYSVKSDDRGSDDYDVDEFVEKLRAILHKVFEPVWEELRKLTPGQKKEKRHWKTAETLAARYVRGDELLAEIECAYSGGVHYVTIVGDAGSGKSTLLAKYACDKRTEGWNVYPYMYGSSFSHENEDDVLMQWIGYIEDKLGNVFHRSDYEHRFDRRFEDLQPRDTVRRAP